MGIGRYPFVSDKGGNRICLYVQRLNSGGGINGEIGMTYTDATTYSTVNVTTVLLPLLTVMTPIGQ